MYLFKNLTIFLKYLLKSKWVFKLPKKNKFVLVDGIHNPFLKYIKKKDFTILHRRGEEINFAIFLKCLIQLKFTTLDYFSEFIKQVSPKLILTSFDYHTIFYKLSKKTGIKTLALQKGQRGKKESIFKNRNFFEIGSFENNFTKPVLSKQKNEVVFISNFSDAHKEKSENENIIAIQLYELAKKTN